MAILTVGIHPAKSVFAMSRGSEGRSHSPNHSSIFSLANLLVFLSICDATVITAKARSVC